MRKFDVRSLIGSQFLQEERTQSVLVFSKILEVNVETILFIKIFSSSQRRRYLQYIKSGYFGSFPYQFHSLFNEVTMNF